MLQLRCTAKVIKLLGLKPGDLSEIKISESLLGNWYVNLFVVDRRKTLLFMNEPTLLSFVIYGVRKNNIRNINKILFRGIEQLLTFEGFAISEINRVFSGYETLEFTRTGSRSVLGNMNDLMDLYIHAILYERGLKHCDLTDIIRQINRTPQRNLGWAKSIDVARQLISTSKQD
jgi:hypothetical protein